MASAQLERGEQALEEGRFREARDALQQGLSEASHPAADLPRYFRLLAEAHRQLAEYAPALAACDRGLELARKENLRLEEVRLLKTRGQVLIDNGRDGEAETTLMAALERAPRDEALQRALILRTLGEVRGSQARYPESYALYAQAVQALQKLLPPDHPEMGEALNNWGVGAMRLGRLQEAEEHLRAALEARRSGLAPDHPDIGLALHNLSTLLLRRGRLDEAEASAREALALWERSLGPRHPRLATVLNNLGGIAERRRSWMEAEGYFRRGLEIREAALGPNHPRLLISINNVAAAAQHLGRLDEAERLFRRSLAMAESVHGPEHPEVARALNNLETVLNDLGRDEEADTLLLRAITIWERTLGPDAPELATSLSNLSLHQKARGDTDGAEASLLRALAIEEKRLGKDHPDLAASLNNLGNLYVRAGRIDAAETLYRRALDLQARAGYRPLVSALLNMSEIAGLRGQPEEERDYVLQAIEVTEQSVGPYASDLPRYLRLLSTILRRLGEREAAIDALRRAMEIHKRTPAREPQEVVRTLTLLGGALAADGEVDAGEEAYEEGIALLEADPGEHDAPLAELLILLGSLRTRNGRAAEAREMLERAQHLMAASLGSDHSLFAATLLWRGVAALQLGENELGEELLLTVLGREGDMGGESQAILALHALRQLYSAQGRLGKLSDVLESLIQRRESMNRDDTRIAGLLHELAGIRLAEAQLDEAASLYERVLAATPDAEPAFRASVAFYLAFCRWHLGDLDAAHTQFTAAANLLRSTDDTVSLLNCLTTVIDFFLRTGRADDALALAEEVESLARSDTVPANVAANAHHSLGNLFGSQRRWEEADAAFHSALADWERVETDDARAGILTSRYHLARLHHARGRLADAELVYLDLIRSLEDTGPSAEQSLSTILSDYATLLDQTERPSAAAEMRQRAERLRQSEPA